MTIREKWALCAIVVVGAMVFNMYRAQNVPVTPNTGPTQVMPFTPGNLNGGVMPTNRAIPRPVGSLRIAFPMFAGYYPYNDIYVDNAGQYFHQNGVWYTPLEIQGLQNTSQRGWDTAGKIGRDGQEIAEGIVESGENRNNANNRTSQAFSENTLGTGHFYYNGNEYRVNDNSKTYFAYPNGNIGYVDSPGDVPGGCQIMYLQ